MSHPNTGFVTQQKQTKSRTLPTPDKLDHTKVEVGKKDNYKGSPGSFLPLKYDGRAVSFQARGLKVSYCGCTTKKDERDKTAELDRSYGIVVNIEDTDCQFVKGGQNDAKSLREFTENLESRIDDQKDLTNKDGDYVNAEKWGCTYVEDVKVKDKNTGKRVKRKVTKVKTLNSLISEGIQKRDKETGELTNEVYDASIRFALRLSRDKNSRKKVAAFTTVFKDPFGNVLNVKPSNVDKMIPIGSFVILKLNYARVWLGGKECKITPYVNEATVLRPKRDSSVEVTDSFVVSPEDVASVPTEDETTTSDNTTNGNTTVDTTETEKKIDDELSTLVDSDDDDISI